MLFLQRTTYIIVISVLTYIGSLNMSRVGEGKYREEVSILTNGDMLATCHI